MSFHDTAIKYRPQCREKSNCFLDPMIINNVLLWFNFSLNGNTFKQFKKIGLDKYVNLCVVGECD